MLTTFLADLSVIKERDPAARSTLEIALCYPGLHALLLHRFSHLLWKGGNPLLCLIARIFSQIGRWLTGIEIHPGARIDSGVFIDHGMGVVIGETAIIGHRCLLYQGVTLGGTGKVIGKRHPTLQANVVVGAGAKILGAITIGSNTRIGAGSVVLRDVPSDCTVVGIPGRVVQQSGVAIDPLAHSALPDTEAKVIRNLMDRIDKLESEIAMHRKSLSSIADGLPIEKFLPAESQNILDKEIVDIIGTDDNSQPWPPPLANNTSDSEANH